MSKVCRRGERGESPLGVLRAAGEVQAQAQNQKQARRGGEGAREQAEREHDEGDWDRQSSAQNLVRRTPTLIRRRQERSTSLRSSAFLLLANFSPPVAVAAVRFVDSNSKTRAETSAFSGLCGSLFDDGWCCCCCWCVGVDDYYGGVLARLRRGLPGCEQFSSCGVCCSSSAVVVVVGEACPGPAGSETAAANLTCNPVGTAKSLPRFKLVSWSIMT